MALPTAVTEQAASRLGLVTRRELRASGTRKDTIDSWVRREQLIDVFRGVYVVPGVPIAPLVQLLAAVLRCGSGARATGWSACALHGLEGMSLRATPWVAVSRGRRLRGPEFGKRIILLRTPIPHSDHVRVQGIPAVTCTRALIDLAIRVQGKALRVAIDDARRKGLIRLERLLERAVELGRHPGAVEVRRLFASGLLDQDGEAERQLAVGLAQVGIYAMWGAEVLPGVWPDATIASSSIVLERDGGQHHSIEADIANDVSREAVLRADRWWIERIRREDAATPEALRRTVERIRQRHIERIAAGLGRPADWRPVSPGNRLRPPRANAG